MEAPILEALTATRKTSVNACLKYHTLWSILHGLVSIKIMGNSDVSNELNKMVLDDAVSGFIRNLEQ
jgi:calcineurin-like phosphoesterase family protein